ncbi:MAG: type II toxin-antitoxin system Phd/YefM family antitoxin [Candidatus Binatia bacterium]
MKSVTVRELQQNIGRVLDRVERGEVIEVTRRRRPIARLSPAAKPDKPLPWPDLERRTREVFGNRTFSPGLSEQIVRDRGDS